MRAIKAKKLILLAKQGKKMAMKEESDIKEITCTTGEMETWTQVSDCCKNHYSPSKDKTENIYINGAVYNIPRPICDTCGKECGTTFIKC